MSHEELVADLTLVVFYLNSWIEDVFLSRDGEEIEIRRAWKGADWGALDALRAADYIDCTNKAKSVYITPAGVKRAEHLMEELGFAKRLTDGK